ncbi:hypothetical protein P8452_14588 [Trifolium repens]|nr:hypothetical protein P8452_14588 [Trifolium repens]
MLSTNLSIAFEEEVSVRNKIVQLEGQLELLRKRKGGLEWNIFEDVYMVIEKNHIFRGIEVHQRDLRRQLNDIGDLQVAEQKKTTMTSLLESSTAAARRF